MSFGSPRGELSTETCFCFLLSRFCRQKLCLDITWNSIRFRSNSAPESLVRDRKFTQARYPVQCLGRVPFLRCQHCTTLPSLLARISWHRNLHLHRFSWYFRTRKTCCSPFRSRPASALGRVEWGKTVRHTFFLCRVRSSRTNSFHSGSLSASVFKSQRYNNLSTFFARPSSGRAGIFRATLNCFFGPRGTSKVPLGSGAVKTWKYLLIFPSDNTEFLMCREEPELCKKLSKLCLRASFGPPRKREKFLSSWGNIDKAEPTCWALV